MGLFQGSLRRRSRDVLVIGEEQLLEEVDPGLSREPQPATEAAPSVPSAAELLPAVEPEAVETGGAAAGDFDEIRDELQRRPARGGIDGGQGPEPVGAAVRGAGQSRASSRPHPRPSGAAASVGLAVVLAAVVTIALETGGTDPSPPDSRADREEREARAPHPSAGRLGQVVRREGAIPERARGDRADQARGSSAPSVVPSTTAAEATAPPPTPAPAASPSATSTPAPTPTPVRAASPAVVQREFGP